MQELSITEALNDPLIRQMLRADKISIDTFAQLLAKASKERRNRHVRIDWNAHTVEQGLLRHGPPAAE